MVLSDRVLVTSYRLSIVTMTLSAAVSPFSRGRCEDDVFRNRVSLRSGI